MYWFDKSGADADVFVSSRVRLARNFADYPFDPLLCETGAREIIEKTEKALGECYKRADITKSAAERHIISAELADKKTPCALFENLDEDVYIMVCEEDHLRIQCIKAGFDLEGAAHGAFAADDLIDAGANIAYDEKLGYLTHCPTNLGCGMRASVMMFLPALTMTGKVRGLENQLSKLGLTIRGTDGEGSDAKGCLYQISNSVTLGASEAEIIENLTRCTRSIAETERRMRSRLMETREDAMRDRIMRSLGCAKYAYMIDSAELYSIYSDLRLGCDLGIIDIPREKIDRALLCCLPYSLSERAGRELAAAERDKERAKLISELLK